MKNVMRVEDSQDIRPGQLVETVYGIGRVARCHATKAGLVCAFTAELLEPTPNGNKWISADLDLAENLKFHTVH